MQPKEYLELGFYLLFIVVFMIPSVCSRRIFQFVDHIYQTIPQKFLDQNKVNSFIKTLHQREEFTVQFINNFQSSRCEHNGIPIIYVPNIFDGCNEKDMFLFCHEYAHVVRHRTHARAYALSFSLLRWSSLTSLYCVIMLILAFFDHKFANPVFNTMLIVGLIFYFIIYITVIVEELNTNRLAEQVYKEVGSETEISKRVRRLNIASHCISAFIDISRIFSIFLLLLRGKDDIS